MTSNYYYHQCHSCSVIVLARITPIFFINHLYFNNLSPPRAVSLRHSRMFHDLLFFCYCKKSFWFMIASWVGIEVVLYFPDLPFFQILFSHLQHNCIFKNSVALVWDSSGISTYLESITTNYIRVCAYAALSFHNYKIFSRKILQIII